MKTSSLITSIASLSLLAVAAQAATITITTTIKIAAGATYNGNGNTIVAKGMGDGSQSESQKPFFTIGKGGTLKSVILAFPGVDGVYYYGNGTVTGVTWNDIGEDAITIKSAGTCTLSSSKASSASDKFGQSNAAATWTMSSVTETTCGKVIRQNGGTTYACKFYYNAVTSKNCKEAIGRTDSSTTRFYYRSLSVSNFTGSNGWWYGRSSQASTY